jgi:dienelactone hydrolase
VADPEGTEAALAPLQIDVAGEVMYGLGYVPAGPGPHPAVVVYHGFPGYERNLDLAQAIRAAGWTAVVAHYRGSWGSGGTYSFRHVLEDGAAILGYVRSPEGGERLRADPDRIALIGHSMGGWVALMTAAENRVLGAASLAGWNVGAAGAVAGADETEMRALVERYEGWLGPLGGVDAADLFSEAVTNAASFELIARVPALTDLPLLVAIATNDPGVPADLHHRPLMDALRAGGAPQVRELVLQTDHSFSGERGALIAAIVEWLGTLDGAPVSGGRSVPRR